MSAPFARILIPQAGTWGNHQHAPLFTYSVPLELAAGLLPGQAVLAPFGARLVVGIVWEVLADAGEIDQVRPLHEILDPVPLLDGPHRELAAWLAAAYVCSVVDAVRLIVPGMTGAPRIDLVNTALSPSDAPLEAAGDDAAMLALIGLLRGQGVADEQVIRRALGPRRAGELIAALEARGALTRTVHPTDRAKQRHLAVRLVADGAEIATWRAATLTALGTGATTTQPLMRRTPGTTPRAKRSRGALLQRIATGGGSAVALGASVAPPTRMQIRLRAALAIIDLLAANPGEARPQREVLRLTRATPAALALVVAADLVTVAEHEGATEHDASPLAERPLDLTTAQAGAVNQIVATLDDATEACAQRAMGIPLDDDLERAIRPILLHGVTGSGKTEVYLQTLAHALARGRRGIVLVPEIALTPQTVSRFAARFPGRVALLHSALRPAERQREWRRIRSGQVDVVIGSRSAIFAPIPDLGLIILDEEHDTSYKQDGRVPTYHAREVATTLARLVGAAVVLGSATPSTESFYRAQTGDYALIALADRVGGGPTPNRLRRLTSAATPAVAGYAVASATSPPPHPADGEGELTGHRCGSSLGEAGLAPTGSLAGFAPAGEGDVAESGSNGPLSTVILAPNATPELPPITIIDLREELHAGHTSILSRPLLQRMEETLAQGKQVILYLNRRGAATCVICRDCGYVARCGRCDVPLTHHQRAGSLICHYCNWRETPPRICLQCGGDGIRFFGIGTERVEATTRQLFPHARVLRWDADSVHGYADHERFGRALADKQVDILIGTQMIAKGLDVPDVTLVGIIAADVALFLPDYRAPERAFQLLTQVAGRAGRGLAPGSVILQTFSPEHFVIDAASRHDYAAFYAVEIATRQAYGYPPFRRFIKLTYIHKERYACQVEAIALGDHLTRLIADLGLVETDIVGPAPAFIERLRDRYRWQMILRGPDPRAIIAALAPGELGPGWTIDIDPVSSL